ncbi:hypothetical protein BS47DRAFT_1328366 [Hydnum rufescens UP504]|uniref:Uracil-DNA glycosylase-like domain-containing protein n=1 Tax=Hydnum rufescens UP504 TaxID=1448309 RepID=A0A9P6DYM9_9AGAM|nr:hypothetical protein BS47DRAFT_1328366 [Hydnum rufescens UP504]
MSGNLSSSSPFLDSISHFAYRGTLGLSPERSARRAKPPAPLIPLPISLPESPPKRKARRDGNPRSKKSKLSRESDGPTEVFLPVPDIIDEELNILFCGINPGETSSRRGHHFARPGNRFWPALYAGGLTERKLLPEEDTTLLGLKIGMTNLVPRPSKEESNITAGEYAEGSLVLLEVITRWRPRIVCFVGFGIWSKFETCLIEGGNVPRPRKLTGRDKSVGNGPKGTTAFAMLPYKVVHPYNSDAPRSDSSLHPIRSGLSDDAFDRSPPESEIKEEEGPIPQMNIGESHSSPLASETASVLPVVPKLEPMNLDSTDLLRMEDHDDNDVKVQEAINGSVRETLFFKMPNTSGLVTHYKPKDFGDFIAALKERLAEYMQGAIETKDFATIRYPV